METFADILARARSGDERAWEELFARLCDDGAEGAVLHAMARRILPQGSSARDFVESRDLLQSALRSGWFDLSGFQGASEGEFFAWMRTILRRKLGRALRRRTPRPSGDAAEEAGLDRLGRDETDPLEDLVRDEARARIRDAVARLPEDQKEVMDLRLQGLKSPDIALLLGIKADAVRKRESRALERLREMLG